MIYLTSPLCVHKFTVVAEIALQPSDESEVKIPLLISNFLFQRSSLSNYQSEIRAFKNKHLERCWCKLYFFFLFTDLKWNWWWFSKIGIRGTSRYFTFNLPVGSTTKQQFQLSSWYSPKRTFINLYKLNWCGKNICQQYSHESFD